MFLLIINICVNDTQRLELEERVINLEKACKLNGATTVLSDMRLRVEAAGL